MLTREENDLLCRVEGDAPMGQMMRRYWLPACLSEEIPTEDCDPVRLRLLGEDLVAFRDSDGRIGVVDEYCPHRGASLFLGRNEECGLRCLYHGWKIDVDGNVLEMASEPPESPFKDKVKHKAYSTREAGGLVWVFMGQAEQMPEFETPLFAPTPDTSISTFKVHVRANWAQCLEGAIDSAHSSSLHSTDMPPAMVGRSTATGTAWQRPSTDKAPRLQTVSTSYGFKYAAIRRPIKNSATHDYVRITHFFAPISVLIPPNNVYNVFQMNVPVDDYNSILYLIAWSDSGPGVDQEAWRKFTGMQVGIDLDQTYRKVNTYENHYGQNRHAMRLGDFTGIRGFPNQDIAMWETMGPIAPRWRERLGASDVAIVEFRRTMVKAVRAFMNGEPAIGTTEPRGPRPDLRAFEGVIPKTSNWMTLGMGQAPAPGVAAE
jgi:phthalate 4,5-dioxygenase oxygenase subunit